MRQSRMREEATRRHKAVSCNERVCMHRADHTQYEGLDRHPKSYEVGKGYICLELERQNWDSQSYEFAGADEPDVHVHRDMAASKSAWADIALRGSVR